MRAAAAREAFQPPERAGPRPAHHLSFTSLLGCGRRFRGRWYAYQEGCFKLTASSGASWDSGWIDDTYLGFKDPARQPDWQVPPLTALFKQQPQRDEPRLSSLLVVLGQVTVDAAGVDGADEASDEDKEEYQKKVNIVGIPVCTRVALEP